jgi:spore coat polysaccharide biosynthesis protein SpsF
LAIFRQGYDIVTNVHPRSYPKGQSFEIFSSRIFLETLPKIQSEHDLEHVTPYFYRNHNNYNLKNVSADNDWSHIQLSVDTIEDLNIVKDIVGCMSRPHWDYSLEEVIRIYNQLSQARKASA